MKTSNQKPPNYEEILKHFDVKDAPVVFTHGDTIWNVPEGYVVPGHLEMHEMTHSKQQGDDPEVWWSKYFTDKEFRLEQELEAYAMQYKFACETTITKNSDRLLDMISHDLASEVYGNIISFSDAKFKIKRLKKQLCQ